MAKIKAYTDLSQSKILSKILPLESADAFYVIGDEPVDIAVIYGFVTHKHLKEQMAYKRAIPCWSLTALLDILPNFIGDYGKCLYYDVDGYYCGYMVDGDFMLTIEETKADNPIDACVDMILKLKERNLL